MAKSKSGRQLAPIIILIALIAVLLMPRSEPIASEGWTFEIFATDLDTVDNLAVAADGSLYASLELPDGQGKVVRLKSGQAATILDNLQRPDGLTLSSNHLYITEEVVDGRVIKFDLDKLTTEIITRLNKPEGIKVLASGDLVVAEDVPKTGRVVKVGPKGAVTVVAKDLDRPEGVAIAADGTIYVAETGTGLILIVSETGTERFLEGLNQPDQVAFAADGALWITEDQSPGRVLRWSDGQLETILSTVESPQGIAFDDAGWIYIAEQGRNRILRLRRTP